MSTEKSKDLKARALRRIPLGVQTLSKSSSQYTQKFAPAYVERGEGAYLWDVDGNRWIDYVAALGPIVLGYAHPEIIEAVTAGAKCGSVFSLSHKSEVELAEKIHSMIPFAEKIRFGKNGSDVTAAAVRAARALTERDHVAICGYHGWQDWYIGTTSKNKGVPGAVRALSHTFKYNDIQSLEQLFREHPGQIAAVIMESVSFDTPEKDFLQHVKELAHDNGALLIFDEVINGFRLAAAGGAEYFGVEPDLITFGKAMANGMPISALAGRADTMKIFDDIFFSFTFGGEVSSVFAAIKTLQIIQRDDVFKVLHQKGVFFKEGLQGLINKHGLQAMVTCKGLPHHILLQFTEPQTDALYVKSYFQQECLRRGVLFLGVHFLTTAHEESVLQKTLQVYDEAMGLLAKNRNIDALIANLESEPIRPIFKVRER